MTRADQGVRAAEAPDWERPPAGLRSYRAAYALLSQALPHSLRRDYGDDMLRLADALYRDAAQRGRRAALRVAATSLMLLLGHAVGGRWQQIRSRFGAPSTLPPVPRDGGGPLRGLHHDIRLGLRALVRDPGYAALVIFTLALAISVNSTMFPMVRLLLSPPVPFTDIDTLVFPYSRNQELNRQRAGMSLPDMLDLQAVPAIEALTAQRRERFLISGSEEPARVGGAAVSTNYFDLLGLQPEMGRGFRPEESTPGNDRALLITWSSWENRFGGDPQILGREVLLDGIAHTVVGVLPERVEMGSFRSIELYRPLAHDEAALQRDRRDLYLIGRLAEGATLQQAQDGLMAASLELQSVHPDSNDSWQVVTLGFREAMVGPNAAVVFSLMSAAVVFVLLIACINVANLTLARATARRRELTVRVALGARRWRVVRQLLIESTLLALFAGGVGLLLTRFIFQGLVALTRGRVGLFNELHIDGRMLLFALLLSLTTPILFALGPALRASAGDLSTALKSGGRGASSGRTERRRRGILVGAQITLAMALLILASLSSRSMLNLLSIDLGFDGANLLTFQIELPRANYSTDEDVGEFFVAARDEIGAIPGVRDVAIVSHRPILGGEPSLRLSIEDQTDGLTGDSAMAATVVIDPGFFETIGTSIARGRGFEAGDDETGVAVAIVSLAAVDRYWPDGNVLGSRIRVGTDTTAPWRQVVGVVADLRNPDANLPPEPHVYLPFAQNPRMAMSFLVRTSGSLEQFASVVRERVWQIDPLQPIDDFRTMQQIRHDDFGGDLAVIGLIAFFGIVAFGLAVAGVYGVVSYSVGQRRRENGVRMAVGARRQDVLGMVTRQGLTHVLAGIVVGLALGLGMARLLVGMLYGVTTSDPTTFVGVPLLLLGVGLVAALIPARRAARLDPVDTLRVD